MQEVDALDWLGGSRSVMLTEEIAGLGSYGKTLTVLTAGSLGGSTDLDDDEELIESWTPRFRK